MLTSTDFEWKKEDPVGMTFALEPRTAGRKRYVATRADLVCGSNSQLRAVARVYAGQDAHPRFVKAFVKAWNKVMMLDRYDVKG